MDIKNQIKYRLSDTKDIRFDKFISEALFSANGYYNNNKAIGKNYDFITAPEISQMFGEIIGSYLLYVWKNKLNSKFNLIELGPGKGTLFMDIANSVSNYSDFLDQAEIKFIEINKSLMKIQKKNLSKYNFKKIKWQRKINFRSNLPTIIYSNEFFDCFPVRQFFFNKNWHEKYVRYNKENDSFYFKDKVVKNSKLLKLLKSYNLEKILEVSFERNIYFEKICKFIKRNGGLIFTIDYGYKENCTNFTLQAIQNHKYSNVLEGIGEKDISSHVNFGNFLEIAKNNNLNIDEFSSQGDFLIKYGILEREKFLSKISNPNIIRNGLNKLIDKNKMGKLFKCLIVSNL